MSVTIKLYSHFPLTLMTDKFGDMSGETTLKCMLLTNAYTPSQDNHDYISDVDTYQVTGTNYSAGGKIMTTTAATTAANVTTFDAADTAWASSTIEAYYGIIYDYTGATNAAQALVAYIDFGADKNSENGTFQLTWNGSGIFTTTVA